jgi:HAD superfamily hydrolase (TIGR01509 family)
VPVPALVIFDCDGVLVDSEPISNAVLAASLTAAGVPTTAEEALREYKGRLLTEVAQRAGELLGEDLADDFIAAYERDREAAFRESLTPVPGSRATVQVVKAAGIDVCVASQGKRSKTDLTLTLCGLRDLFDDAALFSADDVARGKPFPDLFTHAAASRGVTPDRCAVVEDTAIGVTAAVAARMRVLAYVPDGEDREPLLDAGATPVRALTEVPGALGLG